MESWLRPGGSWVKPSWGVVGGAVLGSRGWNLTPALREVMEPCPVVESDRASRWSPRWVRALLKICRMVDCNHLYHAVNIILIHY